MSLQEKPISQLNTKGIKEFNSELYDYNYLGVLFSSHAVFHKAAQQALAKGRMGVANVRKTMTNTKMVGFESRMKLFNSVIKAILLYAAEVWAGRYDEELEKCQSLFFKSVYCLPRNTPCYMLRLEMGVVPLEYFIFKQTLLWWMKLLYMSEDRYPRICYNELFALDQRSSNIVKYNWVSQLREKIVKLGYSEVWEQEILNTYHDKLVLNDRNRLHNTSYSPFYSSLKILPQNNYVSKYLLLKIPICKQRLQAQLRLSGGGKIVVLANGSFHQWSPEEVCSICNRLEAETLYHLIFQCPQYAAVRAHFMRDLILKYGQDLGTILLYFYISGAIKLRSFLRNEW